MDDRRQTALQDEMLLLEELAADEVDTLIRNPRARAGKDHPGSRLAAPRPMPSRAQPHPAEPADIESAEDARDVYAVELPAEDSAPVVNPAPPRPRPIPRPAKARPAGTENLGFDDLLQQAEQAKAAGDSAAVAAHVVDLMARLGETRRAPKPAKPRSPQSRPAPPESSVPAQRPAERPSPSPAPQTAADPVRPETVRAGDQEELVRQIANAVRAARKKTSAPTEPPRRQGPGEPVNLAEELLADMPSEPVAVPAPNPVRRPARRAAPRPATRPRNTQAPAQPNPATQPPVSRRMGRIKHLLLQGAVVLLTLAAAGMTAWIFFGG